MATEQMTACIVAGCGPSLPRVPRDFLDSLPTYGGNYIGRHFQPVYYICIDMHVIPNPEIIETARGARIAYLRDYGNRKCPHPPELYDLPNVCLLNRKDITFHNESCHSGFSLVYVALKLAFQSFDTVYLIGVDHTRGHFYPGDGEDDNPDWAREGQRRHYAIAQKEYRKAGKRIINLSPASELDRIFEFDNETRKRWYNGRIVER